MKFKCNTEMKKLDGTLLMVDQEQTMVIEGGAQKVKLVGGHVLTVGEALAILLTTKKTAHFNPLKAFALAKRLYEKPETDLDEGDLSSLRKMMEEQEHWTPIVAAQVLQALEGVKGK